MTNISAATTVARAPAALSRVEQGQDTIRRGESGDDVKAMQELLIAKGARLDADGKAGPLTERAVKDFQTSQGLIPDGVVGPLTLRALMTGDGPTPQTRTATGAPTTTTKPPPLPPAPSSSAAAASLYDEPPTAPSAPIARGQQQAPIPGYAPAKPTPAVVAKANEVLRGGQPIGSSVPFEADGKRYIARVEWHKHPATDNVSAGLKDWHRGVTVYAEK